MALLPQHSLSKPVFLFCFVLDFIYLFMRKREAETQAEGEAGSMQGARRGTRSRVSRIRPWAAGGAKPLSHPGCPLPGLPAIGEPQQSQGIGPLCAAAAGTRTAGAKGGPDTCEGCPGRGGAGLCSSPRAPAQGVAAGACPGPQRRSARKAWAGGQGLRRRQARPGRALCSSWLVGLWTPARLLFEAMCLRGSSLRRRS